ncbi:hypothetical protein ABK040_015213 [Willaertia magna]
MSKAITIKNIPEFLHYFNNGISEDQLNNLEITNLYARVCKGRTPEDVIYLTNSGDDRTCFLMGADGLLKCLQLFKKGYNNLSNEEKHDTSLEFFHYLGFEKKFVTLKLESGFKYELMLIDKNKFEQASKTTIEPADWSGVFTLLEELFPELYPFILPHRQALENTSFETFQKEANFDFVEVKIFGWDHPNYLDGKKILLKKEELMKKGLTLFEVRSFFYFEMGMRELFKGDGFTWTESGERGFREYLTGNIAREFIKDDIHVISLTM